MFIPSLHFVKAEDKLKPEWWDKVVGFYVYQNHLINLLDRKNVGDIHGYATGDYPIEPFKRMFRSLRKQMAQRNDPNIPKEQLDNLDTTGIQWERVPLIPPKLNSAIAVAQKIPIEINCTCTDPLAQKKKAEDLEFLKAKPDMEAELQPLYDSMNLGEVDMGATRHSDIPYTALPLDLDSDDENEFLIFANLIYNLAPETAFESILQQWYEVKKISQIKLMEITDQYYYAVSTHRVYPDKMTGLPNVEYIYPGNVRTDGSILPDHSDNIIRIVSHSITPLELFKYFPDEICDEAHLEMIVSGGTGNNGWEKSYCSMNNVSPRSITRNEWNSFKMTLEYIEVKSVDSAGIAEKPKSGYKYPTDDEKKCKSKVWAQNTYCAYWLKNTKYFFGIDKLGFAHRASGDETYQNFSTNIYKSQEKSAVELSIGENKKAQMAEIKLQHAIIMSLPNGKIIDMKYIRNAIEGLKEEIGHYTQKDLLDYAMEKNIHIIDSDGFENKQIGQYMPVRDLPGGLKNDIEGYYRVLIEADAKIAQYTNINQQLTGQSANPEGLIGLQKLLINSSLNGLYYVNEAIAVQYQGLFNVLAYYIQQVIKKGGSPKKAIENMIGVNKVQVIKGMNEIPLHQVGIKISLGQREEERALFRAELAKLRQEGKINAAAQYYIQTIPNPKDAMFMLSLFERRVSKREDEARQQQMLANQQMVQQQGQNMLANTQQKTQGDVAKIQVQKNADAELMQLAAQLGLSKSQVDGMIKLKLQNDRIDKQTEKAMKTVYAESNAEQQQPLT